MLGRNILASSILAVTFCSSPLSSILTAAELPTDLVQLQTSWDEVGKSDAAAASWQLTHSTFSSAEIKEGALLAREMDALRQEEGVISGFTYRSLPLGGRNEVLGILLKGSKQPEVCSGFTYEAYKPHKDETPSEQELASLQARHDLSQCRKKLKQIFSGVFHVDGPLSLFETRLSSGGSTSRHIVIYKSSLREPQTYLRYSLRLPGAKA